MVEAQGRLPAELWVEVLRMLCGAAIRTESCQHVLDLLLCSIWLLLVGLSVPIVCGSSQTLSIGQRDSGWRRALSGGLPRPISSACKDAQPYQSRISIRDGDYNFPDPSWL